MMSKSKQFGPWKVVDTLTGSGRTCYLVQNDEGKFHVLKKAGKQSRLSGETDTELDKRHTHSMQKEIEVLKRLTDHPNIITMVDYDSEAPIPWHVTEYCSGGNFFDYDFNQWSTEELKPKELRDKLQDLAKAVGYANSKGISLCVDIDLFVTEDKRFIIGDLEKTNIWETHHIDTTEDIKAFTRIRDRIKEKVGRIRIRKAKQQKQRHVDSALEQAQPSAPRRLSKT